MMSMEFFFYPLPEVRVERNCHLSYYIIITYAQKNKNDALLTTFNWPFEMVPNCFLNILIKYSLTTLRNLTTAWRVLKLQMEGTTSRYGG
jgi:hypothetical protein